jgi:hypothetical protein
VPFRVNTSVKIEGRLQNAVRGRTRDFDSIIDRMEGAYSIPGQNFGLLHDNGVRSNAYWYNSTTLGGIDHDRRDPPKDDDCPKLQRRWVPDTPLVPTVPIATIYI